MKKIFGFNLDIELKERFDAVAKKHYTSASSLLNRIMEKYVDEAEGKIKEAEEVAQKVKDNIKARPPESEEMKALCRKVDICMVNQGKLPTWILEEGRTFPPEKEVLLTPDEETKKKLLEEQAVLLDQIEELKKKEKKISRP